jgi:hypothetical protein
LKKKKWHGSSWKNSQPKATRGTLSYSTFTYRSSITLLIPQKH